MFVSLNEEDLRLIQQTDHMRQVGEIGEAWGSDAVLPATDGRPHLLRAAYEHDRGWKEWEGSPTVDPATHRPHDFTALPVSMHVAFYRRAIDAVEAADPHAGLLVSMHGQGLYLGRFGAGGLPEPSPAEVERYEPAVREFIAGESERQRRLRGALGVNDAAVWRQYALLQAWDRLSVLFCHGEPRMTLGPVPGPRGDTVVRAERLDAGRVTLSPFPFAGRSREFPVRGYTLPDREFRSDADLAGFLAETAPEEIVFRAEAA